MAAHIPAAPLRGERLRTIIDYLRTSFWFVPGIMVLVSVGLTLAADRIDTRLMASDAPPPWFIYVTVPDDARQVISTLLSSMITMATLVFSITMVVLTLAASQFGPRLIRNFMASPHTQFVLGVFVMTIVFCLLALPTIGARKGEGPFPYSGLSIAVLLTLISVAVLVVFLHVLARSIVSETVIERVGRELDAAIDEWERLPAHATSTEREPQLTHAACFGPHKAGYVQAIEFAQLIGLAQAADACVRLTFRPGDYIAQAGRCIQVEPQTALSEDLADRIRRCIVIGAHRTPVQDIDFSIRHLVEIGVRALSMAVNDPYTAIAVTNRLSASFARLGERRLPEGFFRDETGALRVICRMPTFRSLLSAAFDQFRQNGAHVPVVMIHLIEAFQRIAEHLTRPGRRTALREQVDAAWNAAERNIKDQTDLTAVRIRRDAALAALDASTDQRRLSSAGL